jgi:hypothetical protein
MVVHKGGAAILQLKLSNEPKCEREEDCKILLSCPAELTSHCVSYTTVREEPAAVCECDAFRVTPSPDGGRDILSKCVHNPDGGTPICGAWDRHRDVILSEDGGIIVDKDGGVL